MDRIEDILQPMLTDMERAPGLYRPTNFWNSGLAGIISDIEKLGIETFRTHPSARFFYVPVYSSNTYARWSNVLDPVLSRLPARKASRWRTRLTHSDRARADYRLFRATSVEGAFDVDRASESDIGGGERFAFDGKSYSRSMLNYLRALNLLKRAAPDFRPQSCLEIGGGYGTLGEILLKAEEGAIYVNVDIPPVAAVSTWYLSKVFGADRVLAYPESRKLDRIDLDALKGRYRAVVLCPWQLPRLSGQFDLFANFMSFQEMEPDVVANYVAKVQPLTGRHALIRNSAHGKKTASKEGEVGVMEKVTTDFIVSRFDDFDVTARDAFVHGEMSEDGSYRSEVIVLSRRA
ncbi:putative sugar O-methyltransferase [Defluviimonas sp. SAOS-178_SWC]|uniref:putative sugar O-methyltransferase n=1 Tax=Defluviimonas sp. SAOS-178_SWC TaxID=3121287 RepID=UPI003221839C